MNLENFQKHQCCLTSLNAVLHECLTIEEEEKIIDQFNQSCKPNAQVLWSGIPREDAQRWADNRKMQTFTTAMGILMDKKNPTCPNHKKTSRVWTKYIEGACALFAWYICRGETVVLLSPPPPDRFNPNGFTNFQMIEAPILRWLTSINQTPLLIEIAHPTVKGAENVKYQIWPEDKTALIWDPRFHDVEIKSRRWRDTCIDHRKIMFRSAVSSVVGEGFWDGYAVAGASNWNRNIALLNMNKEEAVDAKGKGKEKKEEGKGKDRTQGRNNLKTSVPTKDKNKGKKEVYKAGNTDQHKVRKGKQNQEKKQRAAEKRRLKKARKKKTKENKNPLKENVKQ